MKAEDPIDGALGMMADALEEYANEGGHGFVALEAMADAYVFASYATDAILGDEGAPAGLGEDPWQGDPEEGWV